MQTSLIQEAEGPLTALGKAFQNNPFDFFRENDATCFLHNELNLVFPNRVPVAIGDGIERFKAFEDTERMKCQRVHTEVKIRGQKDSFDIVVLEDRKQEVYPKSQEMIGGFKPPFLIGIEVKIGYGRRSSQISSGKVLEDLVKLAVCGTAFAHTYVVFVDFFEGRNLIKLKKAVKQLNRVGLFYAGLDRHEFILP